MGLSLPPGFAANLRRAFIMAAVVGSVLVLINHGDHLGREPVCAHFELKAVLSYFVPFAVSLLSSVFADTATAGPSVSVSGPPPREKER